MRINLVTGATGFVGGYLTSALLEKGEQVWIIVRPSSNESAETRAKKILSRFFLKWPSALRVIEGDVIAKDLGIKDSVIENLKDFEVVFWHLAATLDLTDQNEAGIWKTNAIGTANAVEFAKKTAKRFIHMSTAYVCGDSGIYGENELCKGQQLRNHYEKSKMAAEMYVRQNCNIPFIIFRPSIIIGDADQGKAEGCAFGYYQCAFWLYSFKERIEKVFERKGIGCFFLKALGMRYDSEKNISIAPWLMIPYPENGYVDMVTIDHVISSMLGIYEKKVEGISVHITHNNPPALRFILHSIMHDVGFRGMKLVPIPPVLFRIIMNIFYFFAIPVRKYVKPVMQYVPYFTREYHFERALMEKYGEVPPEINRELMSKINIYAKEHIFKRMKSAVR